MHCKTHGAIAAGHPKTVEAGMEMFQMGGNAFDAAVAAVLASFVVEPMLTSVAGGGFLLAHTSDDRNILFDFFTQTPRRKRNSNEVDFYPVDVNFGSVIQQFHIGLGSIAVPGTIGGLMHVHQRLGKLPRSVLFEPAIHYAQTGVEVTDFQAYSLKILSPIVLAGQASRQIYAPTGHVPKTGEQLRLPDLANTLSYLATVGAEGFYQGEIAHQLVKDCQEQGGYLTLEDLKTYQVLERQPLMTTYRNNAFLTNPPPSSGGALIAFSLALLEKINLDSFSFGSLEHICTLATVMRLTNLARTDGYDARLYEPDVSDRFLSSAHLAPYAQQLETLTRSWTNQWTNQWSNKWGSTTHVSAIDREGNAASVTTSNGEGSSYVIPGTGIMMNNMLGEADLHPGGFHQWQENVRISSMMAPTMILDAHHQPEIVLGSGGSNRIRTAILQVISNLIDFKMPVEAAVSCSRVHWENGTFNLEPELPTLEIDAIDRVDRTTFPFNETLEQWSERNMFFGGVHAVSRNAAGELSGAGDRRRGGAFAISK